MRTGNPYILSAVLFLSALPELSHAETLYWAGGGSAPVTGGSGTWDFGTANWNTSGYGTNGAATTKNYTAATIWGTNTNAGFGALNRINMDSTNGLLTGQMVVNFGLTGSAGYQSQPVIYSISGKALTVTGGGTGLITNFVFGRAQDTLVFGGTAGTVTAGTNISFGNGGGGIRFDTDGYTVTAADTNWILYSGATTVALGDNNKARLEKIYGAGTATLTITGNAAEVTIADSSLLNTTLYIGNGTGTTTVAMGISNSTYAAINDKSLRAVINNFGVLKLDGNNTSLGRLTNSSSADYSSVIENGGTSDATLKLGGESATGGGGTFVGVLRDGSGGGKLGLNISGSSTYPVGFVIKGTNANSFSGDSQIVGTVVLMKSSGVQAMGGNITLGITSSGTRSLTLSNSEQIADNSVISISSGQGGGVNTFYLKGYNETIGGLTTVFGTGTNSFVQNSAATDSTLTISNTSTNHVFSGSLQNGGTGKLNLVKTGTGTLTLNGSANAYSGTTAVTGGTLRVNSTMTNTSVSVSSTGVLGGSGSLGSTTVGGGGKLTPGNSPGTLTINGDLTWTNGGSYDWEIFKLAENGGVAGTDWDLVNATGNLNISGLSGPGAFTINLFSLSGTNTSGALAGFTNTSDYEWKIVDAGGITGSFNPALLTLGLGGFTAYNNVGTGTFALEFRDDTKDLFLTYRHGEAVPEPGTWAVAAILSAGVAAKMFRSRRLKIHRRA